MTMSQSLLLLSVCTLLLATCFAFIPSNNPALIAPRHHLQSYTTELYARVPINKQNTKKNPFQKGKTTRPLKKNTRGKTPSKQAAKKNPFQRANNKTTSKQAVKKNPFQRAPSKQAVKKSVQKKPVKRSVQKKPVKRSVQKKPVQRRTNTPSKQNRRINNKRKTLSKNRRNKVAVAEPYQFTLLRIATLGAAAASTAVIVGSIFATKYLPELSSGVLLAFNQATTEKVKNPNAIGRRKPTTAPKGYDLDVTLDAVEAIGTKAKEVVSSETPTPQKNVDTSSGETK